MRNVQQAHCVPINKDKELLKEVMVAIAVGNNQTKCSKTTNTTLSLAYVHRHVSEVNLSSC